MHGLPADGRSRRGDALVAVSLRQVGRLAAAREASPRLGARSRPGPAMARLPKLAVFDLGEGRPWGASQGALLFQTPAAAPQACALRA